MRNHICLNKGRLLIGLILLITWLVVNRMELFYKSLKNCVICDFHWSLFYKFLRVSSHFLKLNLTMYGSIDFDYSFTKQGNVLSYILLQTIYFSRAGCVYNVDRFLYIFFPIVNFLDDKV